MRTYSGRSVRHEPVWLARLEPTSSVIANGFSSEVMIHPPRAVSGSSYSTGSSRPKRWMLRSARAWIRAITSSRRTGREQVAEPRLQLQVLLDRDAAPDLRDGGDVAVGALPNGEDPGLDRQPRHLDRVARWRAPAERAGDEHVDVARAVDRHCLLHLGLEVAQVGDRRRRHIRDLVRERDQWRALALTPRVHRAPRRRPASWSCAPPAGSRAERCTPVFM